MRNVIIFSYLALNFCNAFSQVNFKKGYLIKKDGEKIDCVIRNKNWTNTPSSIQYKTSDDIKTISTNMLRSFTIFDVVSYINEKVLIDESSNLTSKLSNKRELEYNEKEVLLKILVKGEKSLYKYKDNDIEKYFFSTQTQPITQFVYKKFWVKRSSGQGSKLFVKENRGYVIQLRNSVICSDKEEIPDKLSEKTLIKFFVKNNNCNNLSEGKKAEIVSKQKSNINLFFIAGLNSTEVETEIIEFPEVNPDNLLFDRELIPFIGLGGQLNTPNDRFSLVFELAYNFPYQSENLTGEIEAEADFDYLSAILGARYHINLGEKTQIFIGPNLIYYFILDGDITPIFIPVSNRNIDSTGANILGEIGLHFGSIDIGFRQAIPNNVFTTNLDGNFRNSQIYAKINLF